jgi:hypothetical protein
MIMRDRAIPFNSFQSHSSGAAEGGGGLDRELLRWSRGGKAAGRHRRECWHGLLLRPVIRPRPRGGPPRWPTLRGASRAGHVARRPGRWRGADAGGSSGERLETGERAVGGGDALTTTRSWSAARSASSIKSASVTTTPRPAWAANGQVTPVNSPLAASTRPRAGTAAATNPTSGDIPPPIATRFAGTPITSAKPARAASTASSKSWGESPPRRDRSTAALSASAKAVGGTSILAVSS